MSSSDYTIGEMVKWLMDSEFERIWKEVDLASIDIKIVV
jgi:hypothetical protein